MTSDVAVLLDLDGTLVDANYQHALAWFRAADLDQIEQTTGRAAEDSADAAHDAPPRRQFHKLAPVAITSACHST